ncbi:MAG: hypothetical protein ABII64_06715 [Elusimicrobiota bacterium]
MLKPVISKISGFGGFIIVLLVVCLLSSQGQTGILTGSADLVLGQMDYTHKDPNMINNKGMVYPDGVAIDTAGGRVYVCDSGNNRVLWWNNADSLTNGKQADGVLGQPDFASNDSACTQAGMGVPTGVCVDGSGNIWVADYANNRILKYSVPSTNGQAASLVLGQPDFTSNAAATTRTGMKEPVEVSVDGSGNVWVSDYANYRVLKFTNPATNGQAASLVLGQPDFTSTNTGCTETLMDTPLGVSVDSSGNVWVVDGDNSRVLKFTNPTTNGQAASLVLGQADFTSSAQGCTQTLMNDPFEISVDGSGNVWVSDSDNYRILKFTKPATNGQAASLVLGQPDFTSRAQGCTQTQINYPYGVSVDGSGNVWVVDSDTNRVLKYTTPTTNGQAASLVLGQLDFTRSGPNMVKDKGLVNPYGVAADSISGRVYVCDYGNNRVLWWKSSASLANGKSADGVLGQADFISNAAATTQAGMSVPYGLAVDSSGNLWVADSNNNRVLKFTAPINSGQAASLVLGQADFTSNAEATTQTGMKAPGGVSVDSSGNVWVVDRANHRVLKYTSPSLNGPAASIVLGQPDFISNGFGCTQATFFYPSGVSVDSSGNVWVVDTNYSRVLKFNTPALATGEAADLVLGQTNFTNEAFSTTQTGMQYPFGVCVDSSGNVWVADTWNHRVLKFSAPSTDGQAASLVLGQADFISRFEDEEACTQTGMYYPRGVSVDSAGNVWVADESNDRVLKFNALAVASIIPNTGINNESLNISDLSGYDFVSGPEIKLVKTGESDIIAAAVSVISANKITCTLGLSGKATGYWDVVVSTGGAGSLTAVLNNGFFIKDSVTNARNSVDPGASAELKITPESGEIKVDIAAGTFDKPVNVTLSAVAAPSSDKPTVKVGSICLEISNNLDLQPKKDITITVNYRHADITGLDEANIVLCRYDAANKLWIPLPTTVDTVNNVITASANHLSKFVVVQLVPAADLSQVKAFPMPFNPSNGVLTIDNLTASADVRIYTIAGELVRALGYASSNGRATWDGKNDSGSTVASGVYIMFIKSDSGTKKIKIAVEK